ncbi:hypothetical protein [Ralstonia syzygii]|uniref:hypothetical protein n=1 Tax=Ralstonia syzygii TaxID=28097 RepID=UPI0036F2486E
MHHAILGQSGIARKRDTSVLPVFPIRSLIYRRRARLPGLWLSCNWKCRIAQNEVRQSLGEVNAADVPLDPAIGFLTPPHDSRAKMRVQGAPAPDCPDPP